MTDTAPKLPLPTLMLVTDRLLAGGLDALVRAVADAVQGGANAVQLREKDLPRGDLLRLVLRLRDVTSGRALLLVNGPLDVALEAGVDGVHLPEDAPPQDWGSEPRGLIVGRSAHSLEAARRALAEGVSYLIAGPVYETASHPGRQPAGLEIIRKVVSVSDVPVIAIGGITAENAPTVLDAGASGVAVISAILGTAAPAGRAAALWSALASAVNSSLQET